MSPFVELAVVLLLMLLALRSGKAAPEQRFVGRELRRLAQRRGLAVLLCGLAGSCHPFGAHDMCWGYWARGYWGGAVAVLGGALLYGGLRRLIEQRRARYAAILAVGLALLANSRPYEGFLVSLPAAAVLVGWVLRRDRPSLAFVLTRVALPVLFVLVPTALAMAAYNCAVTGDPLRMPYAVHEQAYSANPMFVWQTPGPVPEYRHRVMALFHAGWVRDLFVARGTPAGFVRGAIDLLGGFALFYLGAWLLLVLPALLHPRPA